MMDLVRKNGDQIHIEKLSEKLGCLIVEISALKEDGISRLIDRTLELVNSKASTRIVHKFNDTVENIIEAVESELDNEIPENQKRFSL